MALFFPHYSPFLLVKSFIFSRNLSYLHGHGWILFWWFLSLSLSLHRLLKEFSRAKGLPTSFFMCFYWWLCFLNPTWFVSPILNPTFFSCVSIPQLGRRVVAVVPEGQARREPLAFRPGPESRHVAVDLWGFTNIKGQTLGFNQQKWCLNQPKPWIQPAKRTQHRDLTTT